MKNYDWIVFDSTGTLMTPDPEPAAVYHSIGERYGGRSSLDQVRGKLKAAMKRHFFGDTVDRPTDESNEYQRWRRIVADTLTDVQGDDLEQAFESLWGHFAQPDAWRLFPDVVEVVRRLRQAGYRTAVGSNFDARLIGILSGLSVESMFDQVLINSDLGYSKPNPRFYEEAAARLGQQDVTRLLMIGDTHRGDVEAANQAGWHARHLVRDCDDALHRLTADL